MPFSGLTRRHFLRGVGVGVALPFFASLRPAQLFAASEPKLATTAAGAPLRTAFVYFPNGAIPAAWWPTSEGCADFKFGRTLAPLKPLRNEVQVLGGLDQKTADPGPDGAGDHARANGTFLTGVRLRKSATDIHAGVSFDQVAGQGVRPSDALPVAGAFLRSLAPHWQLRLRLLLRLSVQPRLEFAHDAQDAGVESTARL